MFRLHGFYTQNTRKALYVLEAVGADFEFCYVDLLKLENRSEAFQRLTPVGKVPVLEHGGETLFESGAICRYVANVLDSPLYPADKLQRARVDQWLDFFTCHLGRWLTTLYFENVMKPRAGIGAADPADCAEATKFAYRQLKMLNRWLEHREWLANDAESIADHFALAYLEQVHDIDFSLADYPEVASYLARLEGMNGTVRAQARLPG